MNKNTNNTLAQASNNAQTSKNDIPWNHNSISDDQKQRTKDNAKSQPNNDNYNKFFEQLGTKFIEQQAQVIKCRSILTWWFAILTGVQMVIINVLVFIAIFGPQTMTDLLDFMKYYIGATFLELLGGLLIIVKCVFSHETSDMLKHLTYVEPTDKE